MLKSTDANLQVLWATPILMSPWLVSIRNRPHVQYLKME